jgi:hypothetical protein
MRRWVVFVCGVLLVLGSIGSAGAVSFTTTWIDNNHMYTLVTVAPIGDPGFTTWNVARTAAQGLGDGWDLATITSAGEKDFIAAFIDASLVTRSRIQYWIGGYQQVGYDTPNPGDGTNAMGWAWVTGEAWEPYHPWLSGQPDDYAEDQKYLAFDSDTGTWGFDDNTSYEGIMKGYIAEKAVPVPDSSVFLLLGPSLVGLGAVGRRKFFKK